MEWNACPISGPLRDVAKFLEELYDQDIKLLQLQNQHMIVDRLSVWQNPVIGRLIAHQIPYSHNPDI